MSSKIPWFSEVPEKPPTMIPILTPRGGCSVIAVLLSDLFYGRWTHWRYERTIPCTKDILGACEHCDHCAAKWKCWLPGWLPDVSRTCLIELTHSAVIDGTPKGTKRPPFERGQRIRVARRGESIRGRTYFVLTPSGIRDEDLPDTFDVRAQLTHIWAGTGAYFHSKEGRNHG
jgi:hypothetical protein